MNQAAEEKGLFQSLRQVHDCNRSHGGSCVIDEFISNDAYGVSVGGAGYKLAKEFSGQKGRRIKLRATT